MLNKIKRLTKKTKPSLPDLPGKRLAWEILSEMRFPEPEFERDYPIGSVVFDFYCDVLHLAIDIIEENAEYNPQERIEKVKIIYKHDLQHFSCRGQEIIEDSNNLLYRLDFHISIRRKQVKYLQYLQYITEFQASPLNKGECI